MYLLIDVARLEEQQALVLKEVTMLKDSMSSILVSSITICLNW